MALSRAQIQAAYRERTDAGLIRVPVTVPHAATAERLLALGALREEDQDDPRKVGEALDRCEIMIVRLLDPDERLNGKPAHRARKRFVTR